MKYLVTENELLSAEVTSAGDLTFTRENGDIINAGSVRGDDKEGVGSPEGVVTAIVGARYRDTAGTNGAILWVKASGAGATGWRVLFGDTGSRDVSSLLNPGWSGTLRYRRVGASVYIEGSLTRATVATNRATYHQVATIPDGFRVGHTYPFGMAMLQGSGVYGAVGSISALTEFGTYRFGAGDWAVGETLMFSASFLTLNAWPSALPGTPA